MLINIFIWVGLVLVVIGAICAAYKNNWCWTFYSISAILWLIVFIQTKQVAFSIYEVIMLGLNLFAFLKWRKNEKV